MFFMNIILIGCELLSKENCSKERFYSNASCIHYKVVNYRVDFPLIGSVFSFDFWEL